MGVGPTGVENEDMKPVEESTVTPGFWVWKEKILSAIAFVIF